MAKYYIISFEKVEKSLLADINSMVSNTGINEQFNHIMDSYDIKFNKVSFFGLIKIEITKRIQFPRGFKAEYELIKGREFIFN